MTLAAHSVRGGSTLSGYPKLGECYTILREMQFSFSSIDTPVAMNDDVVNRRGLLWGHSATS